MTNLTPVEMLSKMFSIAAQYHENVFDKGGRPYILHPITVMQYLPSDADDELRCIALGHDLIEDTTITEMQLHELGFSPRVVHGIVCMSKVPGESNEDYLSKVKSNIDSSIVKIADLKHNSEITRLKDGASEKSMHRMKIYYEFYMELNKHVYGW